MNIKNTVYLLIALLLASCSNDDEKMDQPVNGGEVNVTFSLALPKTDDVEVPTSRAPYLDTDIKNIDVLVFDKDAKFMQRIKIDPTSFSEVTTAGVKFKIPMTATTEKRIVHLVVNGRAVTGADRLNFSSLVVGTTPETALRSLQTPAFTGNVWEDHVMPLVMWSRFELPNGVNITTKVEGVKLRRTVAAIQVKKGVVNSTNGLNDLIIQGITVHKGASIGNLALTAVDSPDLNAVAGNELDYSKAWVNNAEPTLYIYERANTDTDYASVLVKATYKGRQGYYKVALHNGTTMMNMVRNHRYIITIVGASADGYADINTAINSAPTNALKVVVNDVSEEMPVVVADSQYWMTLSNSHYYGYGKAVSGSTTAELFTLYSSRNVTPTVTIATGSTSWISNVQVTSLGSNKYRVTANLTSTGTTVLTGSVTVRCDNLIREVPVKWNPVISNTKDTDSSVLNLVSTADKNWEVRILNASATNWLGLHGSNGAASAFPGTGMSAYLDAKFNTNAYLHVGTGTNRKGALIMSVNGENRRIEIIQ